MLLSSSAKQEACVSSRRNAGLIHDMSKLGSIISAFAALTFNGKNRVKAQQPSAFLNIPQEIRDEIYDLLLEDMEVAASGLSFRYVVLQVPNLALAAVCKQVQQEIATAAHRQTSIFLARMNRETSLFPFRQDCWGEPLLSGKCNTCRPEDYIKFASGFRQDDGERTYWTSLRIRIEPCKCGQKLLPSVEDMKWLHYAGRRTVCRTCGAQKRP